EPAWASLGAGDSAWECEWWGLTPVVPRPAPPPISRLFPDAGIAVMRSAGRHYLVATNSIVGTKGFGNHKHNDQLSFEYHHDGVPLVVDPGSCVYTSDFDARNLFRSTASHNTLMIDLVEQNEMNREWIFRLFESSHAEHLAFDEQADGWRYAGRHHGYERLPQAVTHEREFRLSRANGALEITDRLHGTGAHELRWHFHLAPGVEAADVDGATIELQAAGRRWRLRMPERVDVSIDSAQYSP